MRYNVSHWRRLDAGGIEVRGEKPRARQVAKDASYRIEGAGKTVPIDPETVEAIAKEKQLSRETFGREPGPEDPLFFDRDPSTPQFRAMTPKRRPGRSFAGCSRVWRIGTSDPLVPKTGFGSRTQSFL